jgi:hypothetical protein
MVSAMCPVGAQTKLTDLQIREAIELGQRYKNAETLWRSEFAKTNTIKSSHLADPTASFDLYTDTSLISMAAATAKHELRKLSVEDAKRLSELGKLTVVLKIIAHYSDNFTKTAYLVLNVGGKILQPDQHGEPVTTTDYDRSSLPWVYTYFFTNRYVFSLPEEASHIELILIGNNNKQKPFQADLSKLR